MNNIVNLSAEQVITWTRSAFKLPKTVMINVTEENTEENGSLKQNTNILIQKGKKNPGVFTIRKPASEIAYDDILFLKESIINHLAANYPLRSRIYKFFGWWFIFAGAITVFSVCPICGQAGCPVGVGTTGILAGVLALVKTNGKNYIASIKSIFRKKI